MLTKEEQKAHDNKRHLAWYHRNSEAVMAQQKVYQEKTRDERNARRRKNYAIKKASKI